MPDTGLRRSPKFQKGALVQIVTTLVDVEYKIIPFQYNPETLSHSLTPWNPFEVDQTQRGAQSPNVQPFDPKESFTLTLEIDATDALEDSDPAAVEAGIAGSLAALKKLTLPSEGGNGDQQEAEHRPGLHPPRSLRVRVPAARRGRAGTDLAPGDRGAERGRDAEATRKDNRGVGGERGAIGRADQEHGAGLDLRRAAQPRAAGDDAFVKGYRARAGQGRPLGRNARTREVDARWLSPQTPQSTSGS